MTVAVGFLVSYDFDMLKLSIPLIYPHVDKIVLAIDAQRKSFTGATYAFDEKFKEWVAEYDSNNKIQWLEEPFFKEGLSPFEIVLSKRNRLLEAMKPSDWFIQLDADEYFIGFADFVKFLGDFKIAPNKKVSLSVKWKTIFKETRKGFLLIAGRIERIHIATNFPVYTAERGNESTQLIDTDFYMLHQSWARSAAEIEVKMQSWSHAHDFDTLGFLNRWNFCTEKNYKTFLYFHPIHAPLWPRLELIKARSISDLIAHYQLNPPAEEKPNPKPILSVIKNKLINLLNN